MQLDTQYRLKNKEGALLFLRKNAGWYKYLNRNPAFYEAFEREMKEVMHLRVSDKIANTFKMIETLENVISSLK